MKDVLDKIMLSNVAKFNNNFNKLMTASILFIFLDSYKE